MSKTVCAAVLALVLVLPAFAAQPIRSQARVYFSSYDELVNKLGDLLGDINICTQGQTPDGRSYLVIEAEADQLQAIRAKGLSVEITWKDIRDKFRAMTGCDPNNFSGRDFGYYFTYWEMRDTIYKLAQNYPQILTIDSSMQSFQHKYMYLVRISNGSNYKPEVFINGATHAREPMGTSTCISFASLLCMRYGVDSMTTWLVNNREIFIMPVVNPDGYVYNSDSGGTVRTGGRTETTQVRGPGRALT